MPQEDRLDRLERIVEALAREQEELVRVLLASAHPVWRSILVAPPDDEPYTPEEQKADIEAFASVLRGEGVASQEDLMREFGISE